MRAAAAVHTVAAAVHAAAAVHTVAAAVHAVARVAEAEPVLEFEFCG